MDKLFQNGHHIGFIQINGKTNPVVFYNTKGVQVNRIDIGIPPGILFLKEDTWDDYRFDHHTEFSVSDISHRESECIIILSEDDKLIYRSIGNEEWASSGKSCLLSESALITRVYDGMPDEFGIISFNFLGDGKYHSNHLPCLIDLHTPNYHEYTYVYHNSNIIIAIKDIGCSNSILYFFDLSMNVLNSSKCQFHYCRLLANEDFPEVFVYQGNDYFLLNIRNYAGDIRFVGKKLDGFRRLNYSNRLIPVSEYDEYLLFQNQDRIIIADHNYDIISFSCTQDRNERTFVEVNNIPCLAYVCSDDYSIKYITDFHDNILFSIKVLYDNVCLIRREVIGTYGCKRTYKYGVCYFDCDDYESYIVILPVLYDEISFHRIATKHYLIATTKFPNSKKHIYGYNISYDQDKPSIIPDNLLNEDNAIKISIISEYNIQGVERLNNINNVVYGSNIGERENEWATIELANPIILCTNYEGKNKIVIAQHFSSDYEYDSIKQLYISPSLLRIYSCIDCSKRLLLNYVYVYISDGKDNYCGILDCFSGKYLLPVKYKQIVNYNSLVLADKDVYIFLGNTIQHLCKIEDEHLIAICSGYMAFESIEGNIFVLDYHGKRFYQSPDNQYIDLPEGVYFDVENKSFIEVDNDVPDYDSGPSWEELGKDEEDYIINNGGDWILDKG